MINSRQKQEENTMFTENKRLDENKNKSII